MKRLTRTILSMMKTRLGLLDVGASGGIGGDWADFRPFLLAVGFEPNPSSYKSLVKRGVFDCLVRGAVYGHQAEIVFNVARKGDVSSVYEPNWDFLKRFRKPERFTIEKRIPMSANTLDHFLDEYKIGSRDFLSIDVQGVELPIFNGAPKTMQGLVGVRTEVEYQPVYVDQPLQPEVHEYLHSTGFEKIHDIRVHWKPTDGGSHVLVSGDSMYVRTAEALKEIKAFKADKREVVLKALAVVALYGTKESFDNYLEKVSEFLTSSEVKKIKEVAANEEGPEPVHDIYL